METLPVTLSCLVTAAIFIYYAFKPQPLPGIPHHRHLSWLLGDLPFISRITQETGRGTQPFEMMVPEFGPVSQVLLGPGYAWVSRWFGFGRVIVVLSDAQEIHDILVNRSSQFDRSGPISQAFNATVPEGMVSLPTSNRFRHHKRWLSPSMSAPYLACMVPRITESMMEMIQLWSLASERLLKGKSTDRAFNAMDDIRLAAMDVIASLTFGASFNSIRTAIELLESDPEASASARPPPTALVLALDRILDVVARTMIFPFPALMNWMTKNFDARWNSARWVFFGFLEHQLDKARETYELSGQNEKPAARSANNVLDMILEKEREDHLKGEEPLSRSEILDTLASYAIAGSETTATVVQWSVKFMARHPEVQFKLHQELVDKLPAPGQRAASFDELSSTERLPYLSAVAYEVLRLAGTAPAVARDTTCDTTILGFPVPKGTVVILTTGYTQKYESTSYRAISDGLEDVRSESSRRNGRRYGYWDDDDCAAFRPERWLSADGTFNPNAGPWMPFSFGIRSCFGQRLAVLEVRMFLALIHATFFLDRVPEELDSFAAQEAVTTHPRQCYVRPIPWSEYESGLLVSEAS